MSAANKAKGALFETDVLKWFRRKDADIERLARKGKDDEGDLCWKNGGLVYIYELKNVRQMNLTGFVKQAKVEAANYERARGLEPGTVHWAVIMKRRGASIDEAFVTTSLAEHYRQTEIPF